jgi:hypothetical protein
MNSASTSTAQGIEKKKNIMATGMHGQTLAKDITTHKEIQS